MLETVQPHGPAMAKDLRALIASKDESHYGLHMVSKSKARQMLTRATRLTSNAVAVVNG